MSPDVTRSGRGRNAKWAIGAFLLAAAVAGFAWAGAERSVPAGAAGGSDDGRPNVVVIQTDDQSAEMMRVMAKTRRLLGRRGATFPNTFTNWPVCCPSRATQLTGQYAHNHGVLGNDPPLGGYRAFSRDDNLAVWLAEEGYRVGHVGKFVGGYGPKNDLPQTPYNDVTEVPPGWTEWRGNTKGTTHRYYDYVQNEFSAEGAASRDGELVTYGREAGDYKTDQDTADATDLIAEYAQGSDPFYLQVDYAAPHTGPPILNNMPHPPFDCGPEAKAAPRHAAVFDQEPLASMEDDSFNEEDVSDKPPVVRQHRVTWQEGFERCR